MEYNPVGWFEIYVQDMARATAFYEAIFQWQMTPMGNPDPEGFPGMEMCSFPSSMTAYGASGALVKMPNTPSGGSTLVYFSCEDCAVILARVIAHGGTVVSDKMSIGEHGFIAIFSDTEGNVIGLHSQN